LGQFNLKRMVHRQTARNSAVEMSHNWMDNIPRKRSLSLS